MNFNRIPWILALFILVVRNGFAADDETNKTGQLVFGWATENITPPKPVAIAGQYHTRISREIHDPLTPHKDLLRVYADADIHNVTAYLASLRPRS